MEMADGTRPILTGWPAWSCARRTSTIFPASLKKLLLACTCGVFLFSYTAKCFASRQQGNGQAQGQYQYQGRPGGWTQPRPGNNSWGNNGWNNRGGQNFGGQGGGGFQQQRHPEHLPQWYRQHQNLSPQDQQRALHNEPGFNRLPLQEQQRLTNRLQQLNSMPPERRQRILQRNEALERLSPEQRQQVRSTMQQVSQMPDDRRRMMRRAFRDIAQLPPGQRQTILDSPQLKTQFSDQERQMLGTMMIVEPYNPEPPPGQGMEYGGR